MGINNQTCLKDVGGIQGEFHLVTLGPVPGTEQEPWKAKLRSVLLVTCEDLGRDALGALSLLPKEARHRASTDIGGSLTST